MRRTILPALLVLALAGSAMAETVTIKTTLGERGFPQGLLLTGRQAASVYLPLPAGTDISQVRIGMQALAVTPNLQRGSVVISANGLPVEAIRLGEDPRARDVVLNAVLNEGELFRAPALDLRFRADLIAPAELCDDSFDPADSLQVLPETRISYDIDLAAVTTLADALSLLPGQPAVEMSMPLTASASAAALKLSAMLANKGYRARLTAEADSDAVAVLRLVAPSADGAIALVHEPGKLLINVPENADIAAFDRLWQAAPAAMAGEMLRVEGRVDTARDPASSFWPIPTLPGPMRVVQTGELGLDFPMLGANSSSASAARLRLMVAPDWSDARPVVTIYLNGQLIAAERAEIGENVLAVPLPGDLLQLSNRLSVTVDRAQVEGFCPGANPGHAVQLLPGTGIDYDAVATGGFAIVAEALRGGGTLVLPEAAKGEEGLAYLTLASRVLGGLGAGAAPVAVTFGASPAPAGPVLAIGPTDADGLVLPIGRPDVTFSSNQPLASLAADRERKRLDIRVIEGQDLPDPAGIFLGNSSRALVGSAGVIWQDTRTRADSSMARQAQDASRSAMDMLRTNGWPWVLLGLGVIALIVFARALIKRHYRRKAAK